MCSGPRLGAFAPQSGSEAMTVPILGALRPLQSQQSVSNHAQVDQRAGDQGPVGVLFDAAAQLIETEQALAAEKPGASPNDIRKAFDQCAQVDDISTIKGSDLEITKEGNEIVINPACRKEIALPGNLGLQIDFAASSKG